MPHKLAPYTGIVEARLEEFPGLSAKRLFDEVRAVRPREPVEAVVRFETPAGRQGQVDFATFNPALRPPARPGGGAEPLSVAVAAFLPSADDGRVDRRAGARVRTVRGCPERALV